MPRYFNVFFVVAVLSGCRTATYIKTPLESELCAIVNEVPGTVGIACISENDTVTVNNGVHYAMMSVFKLHEALAVADALDRRGESFDRILDISASELDLDTYSPMLKKYGEGDFRISVRELVDYSLISSDNNASNLLFSHIVPPAETDKFVRSFASDTSFAIQYSEADMKREHELSYCNYSSPLSAALLLRQVFTETPVNEDSLEAIRNALTTVTTGQDRIGAPLKGKDGVLFAHKTGSGYRNGRGELMAHNDVGYVRLPDGRDYCLAIMIRDFLGTEEEASAIMARISETVWHHLAR